MKHTKAPWTNFNNTICHDKQYKTIAIITSGKINNITKEEHLANAQLIAAAPELLEALQRMLSVNPLHPNWSKAEEQAKKAIKKATE